MVLFFTVVADAHTFWRSQWPLLARTQLFCQQPPLCFMKSYVQLFLQTLEENGLAAVVWVRISLRSAPLKCRCCPRRRAQIALCRAARAVEADEIPHHGRCSGRRAATCSHRPEEARFIASSKGLLHILGESCESTPVAASEIVSTPGDYATLDLLPQSKFWRRRSR